MADLKQIVSNFIPHKKELEKLKSVSLVMIVGPSGVGKTSVARASGHPIVIGDTSRKIREGEKEGVEYHFRSTEDMLKDAREGKYLQIVLGPSGDLYATRISSFSETGAAIFTIIAEEVPNMRRMPFKKTITTYIAPPSYEDWAKRIKTHDLTEKQLKGRLAEARSSLQFGLNDKETHPILNDDLKKATAQFQSVIDGKTDQHRENKARQALREILNNIE
jgi:guanylate kinase